MPPGTASLGRALTSEHLIAQSPAHRAGNELANVLKNPSLQDLVGGIESVTLGDEEARRRGGQKSVLERAAAPTFDVAVEILERHRWRVHTDVGDAVDDLLRGRVRLWSFPPRATGQQSLPPTFSVHCTIVFLSLHLHH